MSPPLPLLTLLAALACRTPPDSGPPDTRDSGPEDVDADGDGHLASVDCDDADPAVFPGAEEICNCVDDDCDGGVDEGVELVFYEDGDGDGWGIDGQTTQACEPPDGFVEALRLGDCDDGDPAVHPEAEEACNGIDDDCDQEIDEGAMLDFLADADGDGWGDAASVIQACQPPSGSVPADAAGDCDDGDPAVHPEAEESCNAIDDDCDGEVDEELLGDFWADGDGDGWGDPDLHSEACEAELGMVDNDGDCDDGDPAVNPDAAEICNGVDDDFDTDTDEGCEDSGR